MTKQTKPDKTPDSVGALLLWFKQIKPVNEINVPPIEGTQKFQVYGYGIDRDTWIFIRPSDLAAKRKKYKERKQWLFGPLPDASPYNVN